MFFDFLGCMFLFALVLFASCFAGYTGYAIVGGSAALALLWVLVQKLESVEKKLDKLLEEKEK